MGHKHTVTVPDLGDFEDVEVVEVLVKAGDELPAEGELITLETDKATMEVPTPVAGRVVEMRVASGDRVSMGDEIAVLEIVDAAADAAAESPATAAPATAAPASEVAAPTPAQAADHEVRVPDIGDFADVEVVDVNVSAGDEVGAEDALITLETDKAAMDVPAPLAGRIVSLAVTAGDKVSEGDLIAVIHGTLAAEPAATSATPTPAAPAPAKQAAPPPATAAPRTLPPIDESGFGKAHASPSVRKFARELGVNLGQVRGSGVKGRITAADVKAFVKSILTGQVAAGPALPSVPKVDFAKFGEIEEVPLTRIQKISGPRLQASWINLPHVTQHDEADFTDTEARRQKDKTAAREKGIKLTPLAFIMRACVIALREQPKLNTSLNEAGDALVYKKYIHMGFAADTEQGLVVPVVHGADKMDVNALAVRLAELAGAARDGKLKAKDLQGGTFTISSLGGIGGTAFTPIINAPEVAILGVSKTQTRPVYDGKAFVPRLMLPLSLSYDHRVVDGAAAVRFTTRLGELLADPEALLRAPA